MGSQISLAGFLPQNPRRWCVFARRIKTKERASTDFVIVRSRAELQLAVDARVDGVMIISDDRFESFPKLPSFLALSASLANSIICPTET